MANETIVDGEVTFHGDVAAIATFVRMNNSFLASHPKAKDKGVGYYTNLFTEDGRFLIDESEITQYLKKSKTFVLIGCGHNSYTTNIEYQLKWLLSGLKNYYFCNQTYLEEEVAKVQAAIQSGLQIEYDFTDKSFNNWDEWKGTVDFTDLIFSFDRANLVDAVGIETTDSSY